MNFGEALNAVKNGKKAKRAGWNGKDQFIVFDAKIYCIMLAMCQCKI